MLLKIIQDELLIRPGMEHCLKYQHIGRHCTEDHSESRVNLRNELPPDIRSCPTFNKFKKSLLHYMLSESAN